jgi:CRISPR-associated protein Cmr6
MRQALRTIGTPDHIALVYDAWAPVGDDGKVPDGERADWLSKAADVMISPEYLRSFEHWKRGLSSAGDRSFELALVSRLLVGHGTSSASDIGLTVHHTWGVPIIPGSALKGLLAHYVDATYGPTGPHQKPWEQQGDERSRAGYQGVTRRGSRIQRGPGDVYRSLFGAPDAHEDDVMREHGFQAGTSAGLVTFHDALYVPDSVAGNKPFAADVLTVHQTSYYDPSRNTFPNDYDSPKPVAFLTVRPGARLLFALSGPADWTELAERLLRDALDHWGVGGKTSAGYGRLLAPDLAAANTSPRTSATTVKVGERLEVVLLAVRTKKGGWRARHEGSGMEGPVQNSGDLPTDKKPDDRITVEVKVAKGKESAFRYLSNADISSAKHKSR